MESMDYWRLCEELNIVQAAMLVVGEDPHEAEYVENWAVEKRPKGYEAAKSAISHALKKYDRFITQRDAGEHDLKSDPVGQHGGIAGHLVPLFEHDINGNICGQYEGSIDLMVSTVEVESLRAWLASRGFRTGFFFPEPIESLDFLDSSNPRYAPKLAAAVRAWQAVTNPGKKTPKQALDKWLRENAAAFGLSNEEGKPIETAIEECSKVANWNAKGGVVKL